MRTARSSSRLLGWGVWVGAWRPPPGMGLEAPQVWAWRPPGQTPQLPPGCGPVDTPLARPLNFPPGHEPGDHQCRLGYIPPPVDRQTRVKT